MNEPPRKKIENRFREDCETFPKTLKKNKKKTEWSTCFYKF